MSKNNWVLVNSPFKNINLKREKFKLKIKFKILRNITQNRSRFAPFPQRAFLLVYTT